MSLKDDESLPYTVEEKDGGRYSVYTPGGRNLMVCRDKESAAHYAALLSEAYRLGYKQGYRDCKSV